MIWVLAAALLVAVLLVGLRLYRRVEDLRVREAERRQRLAVHLDQRERARRVLAGEVAPLAESPLELPAGERLYYRTEAAALSPEDDGGFRRGMRGELLVTNRAIYFLAGGQVRERRPVQQVERVDVPYANVVALVSFQDTLTRDERRAYFEVAEPLVLAAHVSRFSGFELILS